MSVVGEVASILTLIKAARVLATSTCSVVDRLRKAPSELTALIAQILALESELELIQYTADTGHNALVDEKLRNKIFDALTDARNAVATLNAICTNAKGNESISSRLRWMRKENKVANDALREVQVAREKLQYYMQLISCRGSSLVVTEIGNLKRSLAKDLSNDEEKNDAEASSSTDLFAPKSYDPRRLDPEPWSLGSNWAIFGVKGGFVPTTQGAHQDYFLAMQLSIPLSQIISPYAFIMSLSVRTFPLCPSKFNIHGSSFALARIVPEDDPFMVACDEGNLIEVRTMLQKGQGRPTDMIDRNWSPLAFAIRSGNPDVVKELLENGADINAAVGVLQTTPLQWAIWHKQLDVARLLLESGASQDHINGLGWNTTFFCWPILKHGEQCMLDFLNLLAEDSYQDLDVADTEGWTALHRVAAFGTPQEAIALLKLGADPRRTAPPLHWNAIHHAVFYGNHPTFEALVSYYSDVARLRDERGWTLLHIAASAGHDNITRHLVRLGADCQARSKPFMSHMPESLFKRACTPQEVAAAQGQEEEQLFLEAIRDQGASRVMEIEDDSDDEMMFMDANENWQ